MNRTSNEKINKHFNLSYKLKNSFQFKNDRKKLRSLDCHSLVETLLFFYFEGGLQ